MTEVVKELVFLHVPHTGGRVLISEFKKIKEEDPHLNVVWPHQPRDFHAVKRDCVGVQQYFILRPTIDRLLGQFIHYTKRLQLVGIANHLRIGSLPKGFQLDNPRHFFMIEENRNLYCKFLLNRKDFSKPVTFTDFKRVLAFFNSEQSPIWDVYTFPNKFTQLETFLERTVNCQKFNQSSGEKREGLKNNKDLIRLIELLNKHDIVLYEKLIKIKGL